MTSRRPLLRRLASRAGILLSYRPSGGGPARRTSNATCERLLEALGLEAGSEAAARRSLRELEDAPPPGSTPREPESARAFGTDEALAGRRVFGLWANLYALRSRRNLGVGDLGDLHGLVELAAATGAAFVGVSPLHALRNRGDEISPYAPLSRLFRNPLYLDVDAVPEADAPAPRRLRESPQGRREVAALRAGERIDPERAARFKERLAQALHAAFRARHAGRDTPRARAFAQFCRREGPLLDDFATFCALEEAQASRGAPRDARRGSTAGHGPGSPELERFRAEQPEAVDRQRFVQFELDRQLAAAAAHARRAGMPLGLYTDLALGSRAGGFDPWAFPGLFVPGVSVGAPPDAYAAEGQDWGFPPLHPTRIAGDDFAFFRRLLRTGMAHAGALRIDHVLGFFRQWWIPAGRPASEGAYVRFPARALLRVAAQESRRARALLIGEDLGTVPPQVAPTLAHYGLLSSRVLLFEREADGRFKPASRWSARALATANTHDLPTLRAWVEGRDLTLRRRLGLIPDDAALAAARREREGERRALHRRLVRDGHLEPGPATTPPWPVWARACHALLCATPSPLVGLALGDLTGEVEPVNVPGVGPERWPSWTQRMEADLESLARGPGFAEALAGAASRGAAAPPETLAARRGRRA